VWINPEVEIPEELIAAQRDGRLVVFAGAGISVSPPSGLPTFEELADQVGRHVLSREKNEPPDRYLGRLEGEDVDVDAAVRRLLDPPGSAPTQLHRELVALFRAPEQLKVVTTNFDRHLSTAAAAHFGRPVERYCGPALPLGRTFEGIIYLHGSLDVPAHPLVLSDAAFGRAYISDGWASRFLLELFRTHAVLFVGYSHADPVMGYLARSLLPGTARFAFTGGNDPSWWRFLGIEPVLYPMRQSGNRHAALPEALNAWNALAAMGALEHEQRIRDLVNGPVPLDRPTLDYLRSALAEALTRQFFFRHARTPEWLAFADDAKALDGLFQASTNEALTGEYARWFARCFALLHPTEALALVQKRGPYLTDVAWCELGWHLAIVDPKPAPDLLARWVVLLATQWRRGIRTEWADALLQRCTPDDLEAALLLYHALVAPDLGVRPSFGEPEEKEVPALRVEVAPVGDGEALRHAWQAVFLPRLKECEAELTATLTTTLSWIHTLPRAAGQADAQWDALSYGRAAIEPHSQDQGHDPYDAVIDAARDLLEHRLRDIPRAGAALIDEWLASPAPLLRRLAIHGLCEVPDLDAEQTLRRIAKEQWLQDMPIHHEVFRLLELKYPQASEAARDSFLRHVLAHGDNLVGESDPDEASSASHEQFNLLAWLHHAAPDSAATTQAYATLRATIGLEPRDHPDLHMWSSGVYTVVPRSPKSVDELLAEPFPDVADWLVSYRTTGHAFNAPDREGLLVAVTEACSKSASWGDELAEVLLGKGVGQEDLWQAIVRGWVDGPLGEGRADVILERLARAPTIGTAARRNVVDLLEKIVDEAGSKQNASREKAVLGVSDQLLDATDVPDGVSSGGPRDWLFLAINHVVGRVVLVWIKALSHTALTEGGDRSGLPWEYQVRFERLLEDRRIGGARGRTILASQAHFLLAKDDAWARARLVPLFDWGRNQEEAAYAWHGFLGWGRWNDAIFVLLRPFLAGCYERLGGALEACAEILCGRLAGVALYSAIDPWHDGWLPEFVRRTRPSDRRRWAWAIGNELRNLKPEAITAVWGRWMGDYWKDRALGVPAAIVPEEREAMWQWVCVLEPVLDEVVGLAPSLSGVIERTDMVAYRFQESGLWERHPRQAATLLRALVRGATGLGHGCGYADKIVRGLIAAGVDRSSLAPICEDMARLGCPSALELKGLLGKV
jgi:hypothetical protein